MALPAKLREELVACMRRFRAAEGKKLLSGTLFVELEDEACEIGDALATALMEETLAEQAAQSSTEETACCPNCQRPGRREEPEPRLVQTRRGEVAWNESSYYCRRCRQAFFPSVPRAGH